MANKKWLNIVVDGNSALSPYWPKIVSDYLENIIRSFFGNSRGEAVNSCEVGLLMYNLNPCLGSTVQYMNWTKDVEEFLGYLPNLPFSGDNLNQHTIVEGLAHALVMFPKDFKTPPREYLEGERHCILVATGDPVPKRMEVSLPMVKEGNFISGKFVTLNANFLHVAKMFVPLMTSLSVVTPNYHPFFLSIFSLGNALTEETPITNNGNNQLTVFLSTKFKEAHYALYNKENQFLASSSMTMGQQSNDGVQNVRHDSTSTLHPQTTTLEDPIAQLLEQDQSFLLDEILKEVLEPATSTDGEGSLPQTNPDSFPEGSLFGYPNTSGNSFNQFQSPSLPVPSNGGASHGAGPSSASAYVGASAGHGASSFGISSHGFPVQHYGSSSTGGAGALFGASSGGIAGASTSTHVGPSAGVGALFASGSSSHDFSVPHYGSSSNGGAGALFVASSGGIAGASTSTHVGPSAGVGALFASGSSSHDFSVPHYGSSSTGGAGALFVASSGGFAGASTSTHVGPSAGVGALFASGSSSHDFSVLHYGSSSTGGAGALFVAGSGGIAGASTSTHVGPSASAGVGALFASGPSSHDFSVHHYGRAGAGPSASASAGALYGASSGGIAGAGTSTHASPYYGNHHHRQFPRRYPFEMREINFAATRENSTRAYPAPMIPPPTNLWPTAVTNFNDYEQVWEGCLVGVIHSATLFHQAKALRRSLTAPVILTNQWSNRLDIAIFLPKMAVNYTMRFQSGPIDHLFFQVAQFSNPDLYEHLKNNNLCAKIVLSHHTVILSATETMHQYLGLVFPGDMVFLERLN